MTPSEFIGKFKSKYLWYNLAAMFVVVIILCTAVWFGLNIYTHHGESIIVPNLKHKSFDEAKEILDHLGIEAVVGDTGYVKALKPDCVLEQSIAPGERVKSGHVIYLVINSSHTPTLSLPDVIDNSSLREAMAKLSAMGFKLGQPKFIPGEKDWVYGITANGRNVNAGDKISIEDVLVIVAGNGRLSEEDSTTLVEDDFSDFDEFESAPNSDELETIAPVTESKVHPANPSEKTQREPATTHEQKSGNGPVVRKLN